MSAHGIGAVTGMIIGILLVIIILKICNRNKKIKSEYDERQELIRGRAYKYGFYTMIAYSVLVGMTAIAEISLPVSAGILSFAGLLLGICVVGAYSIWKDAYWGLNNNRGRYLIVFAGAGLINFMVAFGAIASGDMMVDGELKGAFVNLLCGIMILFIAIVLIVKKIAASGKKGEDE